MMQDYNEDAPTVAPVFTASEDVSSQELIAMSLLLMASFRRVIVNHHEHFMINVLSTNLQDMYIFVIMTVEGDTFFRKIYSDHFVLNWING